MSEDKIFIRACVDGHPEIVKNMIENNNPVAKLQYAFTKACEFGHLEILDYMISLHGTKYMTLKEDIDNGVIWACNNGHLNIVKRLVSLHNIVRLNIHYENEFAFRYASVDSYIDMVRYLIKLSMKKQYDTINIYLFDWHYKYIKYELFNDMFKYIANLGNYPLDCPEKLKNIYNKIII
jgi:ankyrin repeat protein